jgi:class 3 adenylate cyclase
MQRCYADSCGERTAIAARIVRFGLALQVRDVLYGNVGGGARLDFAWIGPAANLAAHIGKACRRTRTRRSRFRRIRTPRLRSV